MHKAGEKNKEGEPQTFWKVEPIWYAHTDEWRRWLKPATQTLIIHLQGPNSFSLPYDSAAAIPPKLFMTEDFLKLLAQDVCHSVQHCYCQYDGDCGGDG